MSMLSAPLKLVLVMEKDAPGTPCFRQLLCPRNPAGAGEWVASFIGSFTVAWKVPTLKSHTGQCVYLRSDRALSGQVESLGARPSCLNRAQKQASCLSISMSCRLIKKHTWKPWWRKNPWNQTTCLNLLNSSSLKRKTNHWKLIQLKLKSKMIQCEQWHSHRFNRSSWYCSDNCWGSWEWGC